MRWGIGLSSQFMALLLAAATTLPCAAEIEFTQLTTQPKLFPPLREPSIAWGDYDNDGKQDLLIAGYLEVNYDSQFVTKLYKNNGNGSFTENKNSGIPITNAPTVYCGDYDKDGFLDILVPAFYGPNYESIICRNNHDGTFSVVTPGLAGVLTGNAAWGDFNNDGFADVLMCGQHYDGVSLNAVSLIYRNNGDGTFTDIGAPLTGVFASSSAWGDFDKDGFLDVLITGRDKAENYYAIIYRNNRDGTFSAYVEKVFDLFRSQAKIGDFDNDSDLDILAKGMRLPSYRNKTGIWINNGNGSFTEKTTTGLPDISYGAMSSADFDSDGDLDVYLSDYSQAGIYLNSGIGDFEAAINAAVNRVGNSDAIGVPCDYDNDGDADLLAFGSQSGGVRSWLYRNDLDGTFTDILGGIPAVSGEMDWSDFDGDGDSDVLLAGRYLATGSNSKTMVSRLYRNNRDGTFSYVETGLPQAGGSATWGDYDDDGDADILQSGALSDSTPVAKIFRNNGDETFADSAISLQPVMGNSVWGDYDHDDDLDILLAGSISNNAGTTKIYRNDGDGIFVDTVTDLPAIEEPARVAWFDYDNDLDLDVVLNGRDRLLNGWVVSSLWRNENNASFTYLEDGPGFLTNQGTLSETRYSIHDYDNDGLTDIIASGVALTYYGSWPYGVVYKNIGNDTFTNTSVNLLPTNMVKYALAWGDYDLDGDDDLAACVENHPDSSYASKTYILKNNGDGSYTESDIAFPHWNYIDADWVDVDLDGDLDLIFVSDNASWVFRNELFQGPKADAGGPYAVDCEQSLQLDGTKSSDADGDPFTYWWSTEQAGVRFDDQTLATPTITVSGLDVGTTFDVTLAVTDGTAVDESTVSITVVDTTPPAFTLNGGNVVEIECGGTYTEAGATATDFCSAAVPIEIGGDVDVHSPGEYVITYDAEDGSGNHARQLTRTVRVVDNSAPEIFLNGDDVVAVDSISEYVEPGATALDACAGDVAVTIGSLVSIGGCEYVVTYNAVDEFENHAEQVTRLVQVVDDTAPVITCPGNVTIDPSSPQGGTLSFSPVVSDSCDDNPDIVINPPVETFFPMGSRNVVTCTATDTSGNKAECSFTVRVLTVANVLNNRANELIEIRDAGLVKPRIANSILDRLQVARRHYRKGDSAAACDDLEDLIAYVNKQVAAGKLDLEHAAPVLGSAHRLRNTLGCIE